MSISLYDITVPVFVRTFGILSALLRKGEEHAAANGIDPATLLEARLFPDMLPLTGQIQRASDTAKGAVVRLGQIENVRMEDNETTFADLHARIKATVDFVSAAPEAAFRGREEADVVLPTSRGDIHFTGRDYVLNYALPNFYFHVTTAYDILRHKGVPVGKRDFLGRS